MHDIPFSDKIKEKIIRAENSGKLGGPFIPFIFGSIIFISLLVLAIYRGENISAAWILVWLYLPTLLDIGIIVDL